MTEIYSIQFKYSNISIAFMLYKRSITNTTCRCKENNNIEPRERRQPRRILFINSTSTRANYKKVCSLRHKVHSNK